MIATAQLQIFKKCSRCLRVKFAHEFYKNGQSRDGFGYQCSECDASYFRERAKGWRKEKYQYLLENGCIDCGERDGRCLEFDHVRGKGVKHRGVCYLAGRYGWQHPKTQAEVAKCDVRCCNCHARRHWKA